jgi:hypothetical protein
LATFQTSQVAVHILLIFSWSRVLLSIPVEACLTALKATSQVIEFPNIRVPTYTEGHDGKPYLFAQENKIDLQ